MFVHADDCMTCDDGKWDCSCGADALNRGATASEVTDEELEAEAFKFVPLTSQDDDLRVFYTSPIPDPMAAEITRQYLKQSALAPDPVNHPPHYTAGDIECIDAIRAALTPEEFRGYCKGNAFKYAWRERQKGGDESLAKASWYLDRALGKERG